MNERAFIRELERELEHGMAEVPLPARWPGQARYKETRSPRLFLAPRATVAGVAVAFALVTGVVTAAASGSGPAALVSDAAKVVATLEQLVDGRETRQPEQPAAEVRPLPRRGADDRQPPAQMLPASGGPKVVGDRDSEDGEHSNRPAGDDQRAPEVKVEERPEAGKQGKEQETEKPEGTRPAPSTPKPRVSGGSSPSSSDHDGGSGGGHDD